TRPRGNETATNFRPMPSPRSWMRSDLPVPRGRRRLILCGYRLGAPTHRPERRVSIGSPRGSTRTGNLMTAVNRMFVSYTALVCLAAAGCAATTTRDSTGQYIDDSAITTKVKAALFNDPSLKSDEISVETFKGQVQLSGFVRSRANIQQAMADARGVSGVAAVENDMQLR